MSNKTATTLQQRFGFLDDDLKTGKHDEMMLWLDKNAEEIVKSIGLVTKEPISEWLWFEKCQKLLSEQQNKTTQRIAPIPDYYEKSVNAIWEFPITTDKKFIIGFVDLLLRINFLSDLEYVEKNRGQYGKEEWQVSRFDRSFAFEVKATIPSLGELIRQIRMYETHLYSSFVVVSPDDRFSDALKSQGIHFFKYPSG